MDNFGRTKNRSGRILLLLKTPPPYGGGEFMAKALKDYVSGSSDFVVHEYRSKLRNKTNQGRFALWKLRDFLVDWLIFLAELYRVRPKLVFFSVAKSFPHFLRDTTYLWTSKLLGAACASELHGSEFCFLGKSRFGTWYARVSLRNMLCIRVLGETIAASLKRYNITNTIIIDNGVGAPTAGLCTCQVKTDNVGLVFIGTHSPAKGFDVLVTACVTLVRKGRVNFTVDTMGEWISEEFKQAQIRRLKESGLHECFCFHGLVHGRHKWDVLSRNDMLILPSLSEGQPLVILEAYAMGMPVVATEVGAIPDILTDSENGLLVKPGDPGALCDAIEKMIAIPEVRRSISLRNKELYEKRFRQDVHLRRQVSWLRACADGTLDPRGQRYP